MKNKKQRTSEEWMQLGIPKKIIKKLPITAARKATRYAAG
jgi:hypothetical protein